MESTPLEFVYRAAIGELPWTVAVAKLAQAHNVKRAMLFTPGLAADAGGLCVSYDIAVRRTFQDARSAVEGSPSTQDIALTVPLDDNRAPSIPAAAFVLFRARSDDPLTDVERDALDVTGRHLSIAVRLWFERRAAQNAAEALASCLNAAALIVRHDGSVVWMNRRAQTWMNEGRIGAADGKLREIPGIGLDLPRLIRDAAERRVPAKVVVADALTLEVGPGPTTIPMAHECGRTAWVVLRNRSDCRQAAAALASNFGLTDSEVDLAIALWKGILIAEYAARRSVTMSTVRTQLRALLSKTRSRRQSDVVSIVSRMQPILCDPAANQPDVVADSYQRARHITPGRDTSLGR